MGVLCCEALPPSAVIARSDCSEAIQPEVSSGRAAEVSFWIASLTLAMTGRAACIALPLVFARSDSDEAIQSDVSGGRVVEMLHWIASLRSQ